MAAIPLKRLFITLLIFWLPHLVKSQPGSQKDIDSLLNLITKAKNDTDKAISLIHLSYNYYTINQQKGIDYGTRGLVLAQKARWKRGIELAYNVLGENYWAKYDFIKAQDYYGASLKIAQEIGDKKYIARTLHDIGICYEIQNNYKKAIEYYLKSAGSFKDAGDINGVIGAYSNIADYDVVQLKYPDAFKYYAKCLQISRQIKNQRDIGFYYQQIGIVYSLTGRYNIALKYEQSALVIFKKLKAYIDLAQNYNREGNFYLDTRNYNLAIKQNENALNVLAKITTPPQRKIEADCYNSLGKIYFEWAKSTNEKKNIKLLLLAESNFKKSISIDRSIDYREAEFGSLNSLSDVEQHLGDFKSALKFYKEYIIERDTLNNAEKSRAYKNHELSFEYSKRRDSLNYVEKLEKQEIAQVKIISANKLRQQSLYAIVAIAILLFIVSYFVYRNRLQQIKFKSRIAKEKAEVDFKQITFENKLNDLTLASLKSQMNPHFIFNCLNSIKFYVEKNETEAASVYITKFSKLIRTILNSARTEKVTLFAELELISLYLEMEKMRLKEKLQYEFEIAGNIDTDFIEIPPLLIQPYIENAIWHGIMNKEEGGFIKLTMTLLPGEKHLVIEIADNGVGRKKAAEIKMKNNFQHVSHGSTLNSERIALFNTKYQTNTQVVITDLMEAGDCPCGTSVTIKLLIQ